MIGLFFEASLSISRAAQLPVAMRQSLTGAWHAEAAAVLQFFLLGSRDATVCPLKFFLNWLICCHQISGRRQCALSRSLISKCRRALRAIPSSHLWKRKKNSDIPVQAADIVWARKLLSVIGLGQDIKTPINSSVPISGAGRITITFASCPPGTGPSLHSHRKTYETFTVMQGRFEVFWNDDGENRLVLERFDTISVPPSVCRGFRNIGDMEGLLQVIISGGVHDLNDIDFAPKCAEEIENIKPGLLKTFKDTGLTFTASKDFME